MQDTKGFLSGSVVKNLSAMQDWVWSLGWEDPVEQGMATHFSILAWNITWTEELSGLQTMGLQRVEHNWSNLARTHAGQEATVRTGHGTTDWFKIGKGVCQGCNIVTRLFNLHAERIMWNAMLDESQAEIKISRRNNNLRYADDTTLGRKQRGTKESLNEGEKKRIKKLA